MTLRGKEDRSFRKSIDTYSVLGPWFVTADEIPTPDELDLEICVNGQTKQKSNTKNLIYDVRKLIEWASQWYTLYPGDILMTGTPEGVGPVKPGDVLECTIERIGIDERSSRRSPAAPSPRTPNRKLAPMIAQSKDITIEAAGRRRLLRVHRALQDDPGPGGRHHYPPFSNRSRDARSDRSLRRGGLHRGIVPDIFWRTDGGPVSHTDETERKRAYARMEAFDVDKGVADIKAIVDFLKSMKEYNGKFAVSGFCFGGRFTFLAATRLGAAAGVSFHGTSIGKDLAEANKATCPLSLHFGDDDPTVPMSEVEAIMAALKHNPKAEICVYSGAKHGFSSPSRPSYHPEAARVSYERGRKVLEYNEVAGILDDASNKKKGGLFEDLPPSSLYPAVAQRGFAR